MKRLLKKPLVLLIALFAALASSLLQAQTHELPFKNGEWLRF